MEKKLPKPFFTVETDYGNTILNNTSNSLIKRFETKKEVMEHFSKLTPEMQMIRKVFKHTFYLTEYFNVLKSAKQQIYIPGSDGSDKAHKLKLKLI